jgi:hypothetical protein
VTVFLVVLDGEVQVMARIEGPGGMLGDVNRYVAPGGEFMGHSYEELVSLGTGQHELAGNDHGGVPTSQE